MSTSPIATRTYCPVCNDLLAMEYVADPARIHIVKSRIDRNSWRDGVEPDGMKAWKHIFIREKDPDVPLPDDGLPRFEGFRQGPGGPAGEATTAGLKSGT